jgi:hypothetical protein
MGENIRTREKSTWPLLVASKEDGLESSAEKTKYKFMFLEEGAG